MRSQWLIIASPDLCSLGVAFFCGKPAQVPWDRLNVSCMEKLSFLVFDFFLSIDWLAIFATTFVRTISYQKSSSQRAPPSWDSLTMAGKTLSLCDHLRNLPCISTTETSQKIWHPEPKHTQLSRFPQDVTQQICVPPFCHPISIPQNNKQNCHRKTQGTPHLQSLWKRPQCAGNYRVSRCHFGEAKWDTLAKKMAIPDCSMGMSTQIQPQIQQTIVSWKSIRFQNSPKFNPKAQRNRIQIVLAPKLPGLHVGYCQGSIQGCSLLEGRLAG